MQENKMGVMPMKRLLITMSLPMMLSMLVQALYNVVDSIFVSYICEDALTAISMAFPIQNLLIAVGSGIGVGMNALLSRSLGAGDEKEANKVAGQGIFLAFCSFILFMLIGIFFTRSFFVIQGATKSIEDYGTTYLGIVTICSFGLLSQVLFERLLQSTGRTFYSMITQLTGAIINIILDPIMIFGYCGCPKMGIAGAAAATVIGQTIAGILAIIFNIRVNKEISLSFRGFRPSGKRIGKILFIGIPSVIMVAIGSVMTFFVNKILILFSTTAVAVFGVYFKLQSFAFMPVFGMNNGMIPIVAYNYGAKKYDRMFSCRRYAILYAEIIMLIAFAVVQLFPSKLLLLFNASQDMLSIGIPALRIISISFLFAGFCVVSSSFFQSLGKSVYSMLVSFFRQLIFLVPLAFLFSRTGKLDMVWCAWPLAELISVALCTYFQRRIRKDHTIIFE